VTAAAVAFAYFIPNATSGRPDGNFIFFLFNEQAILSQGISGREKYDL